MLLVTLLVLAALAAVWAWRREPVELTADELVLLALILTPDD
jgi:hypothetical protein